MSAARTSVGIALSTVAAIAFSVVGPRLGPRALLPWLFVIVLIALSARYGPTVSLFGSIIGMIVFASKLFAPLGSLSVADEAAKTSLGWMALVAVTVSYLLYPKPSQRRH